MSTSTRTRSRLRTVYCEAGAPPLHSALRCSCVAGTFAPLPGTAYECTISSLPNLIVAGFRAGDIGWLASEISSAAGTGIGGSYSWCRFTPASAGPPIAL